MIWVGRHNTSPNIRVIYQSTDQRRLPKGYVRLRILQVSGLPKIAGELVGDATQMRQLVKPERDTQYADECVLTYLKLKNGTPPLTQQQALAMQ